MEAKKLYILARERVVKGNALEARWITVMESDSEGDFLAATIKDEHENMVEPTASLHFELKDRKAQATTEDGTIYTWYIITISREIIGAVDMILRLAGLLDPDGIPNMDRLFAWLREQKEKIDQEE